MNKNHFAPSPDRPQGFFLFPTLASTGNISVLSWPLLAEVPTKTAATFAILKKAYPASVIRLKSYRSILLSGRTPWKTTAKIKKEIHSLIDLGLARIEKDKIILLSKKEAYLKFSKNRQSNSPVYVKIKSNQDVLTQIRDLTLQNKVRQYIHRISTKKAESKAAIKHLSAQNRSLKVEIATCVIAKLWRTSKTTAARYLKKVSGVEVTSHPKVRLRRASFYEWAHRNEWWNFKVNPDSCFYVAGSIFYQPSRELSLRP